MTVLIGFLFIMRNRIISFENPIQSIMNVYSQSMRIIIMAAWNFDLLGEAKCQAVWKMMVNSYCL